MQNYLCPVCGFPELTEPPRDEHGTPSYEICPCCGFEYGVDDEQEGQTVETYRTQWLTTGARWFCPEERPPLWSLEEQLNNIGVDPKT